MSQWYFARNGEQKGPYSFEAVSRAVQDGKLRGSDLVWTDTMTEWLPVEKVEQFASALANAKPAVKAAAPAAGRASSTASSTASPTAPRAAQRPVAATAHPVAPVASEAPLATHEEPAPGASASAEPATLAYSGGRSGTLICTPAAVQRLRETQPWVRFIGILLLIIGGGAGLVALLMLLGFLYRLMDGSGSGASMTAIGFVLAMFGLYALAAFLYFMLGLYLNRYASRIADTARSLREDHLEAALAAQRSFWRLLGILVLIWFCITVLVSLSLMVLGLSLRF
jgi:hypothetical protein